MALFSRKPATEEEGEILKDIRRIKVADRQKLKAEQRLSIDYLKNRQVADVEQQLQERFPSSQTADPGQKIYPVTLPLTKRYVAEAANAYNGSVHRYFVDDDGKETDATREQTDKLNRALGRTRYDEIMHANERYTVLLKLCCVWYQRKRFQLRPVLAFPYQIYPVLPKAEDAPQGIDPTDPDDYVGFSVEQEWDKEDPYSSSQRMYSFIRPDGVTVYQGREAAKPDKVIGEYANPYEWEHVNETDSGKRVAKVAPGRMLTFWHDTLNVDELIPMADATIARANREINIAWSMLLDIMRFQGFSVPVLKSPNSDRPLRRHGVRFPVVLRSDEEFRYESSEAPYTESVMALDHFAKFLATLERQSPNDFGIEGSKALSGFAKQVDSLPKIEAREERLRALQYLEENEGAPRLVSILVSTGELDEVARKMHMRARFGDIEFPRTPEENAKEIETDVKYNLTTPAKILADREGISLEEAEEEIKNNAEKNREYKSAAVPPGGAPGAPGFPQNALSSLIARRGAQGAESSARPNRQERATIGEGDRDRAPGGEDQNT